MALPHSAYALYLVALGIGLLVFLFSYLLYQLLKPAPRTTASYESQLEELLESDGVEAKESSKPNALRFWHRYWGERFQGMGWASYSEADDAAGKRMALVGFLIAVVFTALTRNVLAGFFVAALGLYGAGVFMKQRILRERKKIDGQLPEFLEALKSNVKAGNQPEEAVLAIIDNVPQPLRSDLEVLRQQLLTNVSFAEALQATSRHTSSSALKFLCACMTIAAESGASIEDQITSLQEQLRENQKVAYKISEAEKYVAPSIALASFLIVGFFAYNYFINPSARDYWFHSLSSWVVLFVIVGLYLAGVGMSRRFVNNIKKL